MALSDFDKDILEKIEMDIPEGVKRLLLEILCNAGNVNAKNDKGYTALMLVKNPEHADILIKSGADVNAKNNNGETALMLARSSTKRNLLIDAGAC